MLKAAIVLMVPVSVFYTQLYDGDMRDIGHAAEGLARTAIHALF